MQHSILDVQPYPDIPVVVSVSRQHRQEQGTLLY